MKSEYIVILNTAVDRLVYIWINEKTWMSFSYKGLIGNKASLGQMAVLVLTQYQDTTLPVNELP